MPPAPPDHERARALAAALAALRSAAADGAEEVLGHFPELGERVTQLAVDGFLEQLADTFRALDEQAAEVTGRLVITEQRGLASGAGPSPEAAGERAEHGRGWLG